ncbi:MAG TPA: kelch repeat-containing protein [Chloroflexota bacterium]|nr:kelch repeat-containing protein [Chloroflexota bacterium]
MITGYLLRCLLALPLALLAFSPTAVRAAAPAAGAWIMTGSMHETRALQTATLLTSGLVLIAGGNGAQGTLASAELYHPNTGSWASTGSMHEPRVQYTATLLSDGQVLVVGGFGSQGLLASAELYHPRTGNWTVTGSLHQARANHTATLLPNGQVLVAGGAANGANGTAVPLAGAELYDPRTGKWTQTGAMHRAREPNRHALARRTGSGRWRRRQRRQQWHRRPAGRRRALQPAYRRLVDYRLHASCPRRPHGDLVAERPCAGGRQQPLYEIWGHGGTL